MATNGTDNVDKTMELCSKAIGDIFEECAKRYEDAIEAENVLHDEIILRLKSQAASCRVHGQEAQTWLDSRATSAREAISGAAASMALLTPGPQEPKEIHE